MTEGQKTDDTFSYRSLFHGCHDDFLQSCGLLLISWNPWKINNFNMHKSTNKANKYKGVLNNLFANISWG